MTLERVILDGSMEEIGAHFSALDPAAKLAACRSLGPKQQRTLFAKAVASAPLTLEDFVGAQVAPLTEVIHEGRNTLPLFKLFQKRFCRPQGRDDVLFGYNEGSTRALIGPGYFIARSTAGDGAMEEQGAIVVDYYDVPSGAVVAGWPQVIPNNQGLQRFVYNRTRDYMRAVAPGVTIGAAFKEGKPLGAYFVLCRQDP